MPTVVVRPQAGKVALDGDLLRKLAAQGMYLLSLPEQQVQGAASAEERRDAMLRILTAIHVASGEMHKMPDKPALVVTELPDLIGDLPAKALYEAKEVYVWAYRSGRLTPLRLQPRTRFMLVPEHYLQEILSGSMTRADVTRLAGLSR